MPVDTGIVVSHTQSYSPVRFPLEIYFDLPMPVGTQTPNKDVTCLTDRSIISYKYYVEVDFLPIKAKIHCDSETREIRLLSHRTRITDASENEKHRQALQLYICHVK